MGIPQISINPIQRCKVKRDLECFAVVVMLTVEMDDDIVYKTAIFKFQAI